MRSNYLPDADVCVESDGYDFNQGGALMIILKVLTPFFVLALLTGCVPSKDIEEIKTEIRNLKQDLKEFVITKVASDWQACEPPGIEQNIQCHYKLKISKIDGQTATGQIPEEVLQFQHDNCEKLTGLPQGYICANPKGHLKDIVFTFELVDPQSVKPGPVYHFVNVPGKSSLQLAEMSAKDK